MEENYEHDADNGPPLTAEERARREAIDHRIEESEKHLKELEGDGWIWQSVDGSRVLVSPDGPDFNIFYNPFEGEILYSAKLVKLIEERIRAKKEGGGTSGG